MVPTSSQDEALARYGVSRDVPCSALKGERVPDSFHATPKSPRHTGFSRGEHRGSRHRFICAPSPLLIATGESIPLSCQEGSSAFPAHLRMKPASLGNLRLAPWVVLHAERPRFPCPLLKRTGGPDTSSKASQWVKAQHEGALSLSCIVRKHPQVPHTAQQGA